MPRIQVVANLATRHRGPRRALATMLLIAAVPQVVARPQATGVAAMASPISIIDTSAASKG